MNSLSWRRQFINDYKVGSATRSSPPTSLPSGIVGLSVGPQQFYPDHCQLHGPLFGALAVSANVAARRGGRQNERERSFGQY